MISRAASRVVSVARVQRPHVRIERRAISSSPSTLSLTKEDVAHAPKRILVTGACGQVGSELIPYLRTVVGDDNVIASDIKRPKSRADKLNFHYLDVLDFDGMCRVALEEEIDTIVHLGAVLSAAGEKYPALALKVNSRGSENVLELARQQDLRVYIPSSIAAFGPTTPLDLTPNITVQRPRTMYGVNKVTCELLGEYYHEKFGVDYRALRYPGVISNVTQPGGGTTDYAVEIFYEALKNKKYTCFLAPDARLPMMYMPDCLKSTTMLLCAPKEKLRQRTYNIAAVSFTPEELVASMKKHIPELEVDYKPDFRQNIAASWPKVLDDTDARNDFGWKHDFGLDEMVEDMLNVLDARLRGGAQ